MNATVQIAAEDSSRQTVGLSRVINNSVALVLLDLLNKAIPLVVFPRVVRALGPAAYGRLGFAGAVAGLAGGISPSIPAASRGRSSSTAGQKRHRATAGRRLAPT